MSALTWTTTNSTIVAKGNETTYRIGRLLDGVWAIEARDAKGKLVLAGQYYRKAWAQHIAELQEAKGNDG